MIHWYYFAAAFFIASLAFVAVFTLVLTHCARKHEQEESEFVGSVSQLEQRWAESEEWAS